MDPKPYLDYLDKEMTIMGILSAFSVAALGGVFTILTKADQIGPTLWSGGSVFLVAGSAYCLIAASLFYKQRSRLARFYGELSLVQSRGGTKVAFNKSLKYWFDEIDSWPMWLPYCCAFTFLFTGFVEYLLAITFCVVPSHWHWLASHLHGAKRFSFTLVTVTAILFCALQCYVRLRYADQPENVWIKFWHVISGKKQ